MGMLNSYVGWHQIMHFLFALANLGVLVLSSYHMARYDGYGFYSFDTDKTSGDSVWSYTNVKAKDPNSDNEASYETFYDETLGQTCTGGAEDKYSNWANDKTDFTWNGFKQTMELLKASKRFHVDIGNPIDKVILEIDDATQFPVCLKADNHDASDHHASMQICAVLEHDNDSDNNFSKTRTIMIMLMSFSAVFFVLEVLYIINMIHARGAVKQYMVNEVFSENDASLRQQKEDRLYHRIIAHGGASKVDATVDSKEDSENEAKTILNYAKENKFWNYFLMVFHIAMYTITIVLSAIFLAYVKDSNDDDEHFEFSNVAEYDKSNKCYKDPYAPAVKLALTKLKQDNITDELSSAYGIVSIYLIISAVCCGFYYYFIINKAQTTPIQGNNTMRTRIGENVNYSKSTGSRLADGLFRRGREIVNLQF